MKEYGCWTRDAWGYFLPSKATFCAAGGFLFSRMHISQNNNKCCREECEDCERSWEVRCRAFKMEGENCKQENNNVRDGARFFLFFSFFLFVITFCRFKILLNRNFLLCSTVCVCVQREGAAGRGGKENFFVTWFVSATLMERDWKHKTFPYFIFFFPCCAVRHSRYTQQMLLHLVSV